MFIFEIVTPGAFLECQDSAARHRLLTLVSALKQTFFEANVALNLFTEERGRARQLQANERRQEFANRRRQIEEELGTGACSVLSWEQMEAIRYEAEVIAKREAWQHGHAPFELEHPRIFIFARSFLYALDQFEKLVAAICEDPATPTGLSAFKERMSQEFPDLREVRNSAHHMEDRVRGLGRNGKSLNLTGLDNEIVSAPNARVLILNSLIGNRYGSTMADGSYGEVDVTPESLAKVVAILEGVLQTFTWSGPTRHEPSGP